MKPKSRSMRSSIPVLCFATAAVAATAAMPGNMEPDPAPSRNRFGASFRLAFNVKVDFEHIGSFASPSASRLTPDGDPFNYDDGYVLLDDTGMALGVTRYWGYDSASQVPGDGTLVMHRSSSAAGATSAGLDDDPLPGFELNYRRELGRSKKLVWGAEAAFGYMNVSIRDSRPLTVAASQLSYAYPLPPLEGGGFVSPPPAPYQHGRDLSPEGNPVIGATPAAPAGGMVPVAVTGSRIFDADVFGFRLGPYLELPLGEKWSVAISGGLALAEVCSDFTFNEAVALTGVPPATGAGSHSDLRVGYYAAGTVGYKINPKWGVFAGVQFQDVGKYRHEEQGRAAVLDLSRAVFVMVGANVTF